MKLKNLLLYSLIIFFIASCGKQEEDIIKIGAILELSGDGAELGKDAKRGIELATERINHNGGISGKKVKFIYEDNQSNTVNAVNAINKLITVDKVQAIVGALFSSATLAMAPIAERNHVILFSPGSSNPKLTYAGEYIFRNYPSDNYEGTLSANYLHSKNITKIPILYVNNDYGSGLRDVFSDKFEELGGHILLKEGYKQGNTDFRTILAKIHELEVSSIYMPGYFNEVGYAMKQAKELGFNFIFFSNIGVADPKIFEIGGDAVNGLMFTAPKLDLSNADPQIAEFVKAFLNKYKQKPGFPAAYAYDTAKMLFWAMKNYGFGSEKIKEGLYHINNFKGVTGSTSIDRNGDVKKDFIIKVIRNDKFEDLYDIGEGE